MLHKLSAVILTLCVLCVTCDPQVFLDVSVMPRAHTQPSGKDTPVARGFKIHPYYMLNEKESQLLKKLVDDAVEFFKLALKLKQPVKSEGILLSRTCEYTKGTFLRIEIKLWSKYCMMPGVC